MKKLVSLLCLVLIFSLLLSPLCYAAESGKGFMKEDAYVYTLDNGMPKYWLDLTGSIADNPVLHCFFRSGDPNFYEVWYILERSNAYIGHDQAVFRTVYDQKGQDISQWFKKLSFSMDGDGIVMTVERNDSSLAGGGEDNLLSGSYTMSPAGVVRDFRYHQDDGMLKYWIDSDGEDLLLHAMFRSDTPIFKEEVFIIDHESAEEINEYSVNVGKLFNSAGKDVSSWFSSFSLTLVQGAIIMNIIRDETTLAGGADDNFLTGVYLLEPYTRLRPAENGPYSEEELGTWAQIYYFSQHGFYPLESDVVKNSNGSFTIHLYEVMDLDGLKHTATSAWYTVDEYGVGTDDIAETTIRICG